MKQPRMKTLAHRNRNDELLIKPGELIDVNMPSSLNLQDRRIYNMLLDAAWGQLGDIDATHEIRLTELRPAGALHDSNDRTKESIRKLVGTSVELCTKDDAGNENWRIAPLLGGASILTSNTGGTRPGFMTYSFDKVLVMILKNSTTWGQLQKEVMFAFSSKYALSLYEMAEKRISLKRKVSDDFALDVLREQLGVPHGKLTAYRDFNRRALKTAVEEVNGLSDINIKLTPIKEARRVVGVTLEWWRKDDHESTIAAEERERHATGRRARLQKTTETIVQTKQTRTERILGDIYGDMTTTEKTMALDTITDQELSKWFFGQAQDQQQRQYDAFREYTGKNIPWASPGLHRACFKKYALKL